MKIAAIFAIGIAALIALGFFVKPPYRIAIGQVIEVMRR